MGDPRRIRSKWKGPSHPWQMARLEKEEALVKTYGLKNKKELWKMDSKLKNYKKQAKLLAARSDEQSEKEKQQLFASLFRLGLIEKWAKLDNILDLDIKDILNRRLQTLILKRGYARTIKQARQMVVHEHVMVDGRKIDAPSYMVRKDEEDKLSFSGDSSYLNPDHPERTVKAKEEKSTAVTPRERTVSRVDRRHVRTRAPARKAEAEASKPAEKPAEKEAIAVAA